MSDDVCYHELAGNKSVSPADRRQTQSNSTDRDAKSAKIGQDGTSTVLLYTRSSQGCNNESGQTRRRQSVDTRQMVDSGQ